MYDAATYDWSPLIENACWMARVFMPCFAQVISPYDYGHGGGDERICRRSENCEPAIYWQENGVVSGIATLSLSRCWTAR